ncbi:MAG: AbrB/MazE/SpoVT family DNA-binding domain-containing protein [Verrucomicrobia bacterium]|nr:AbrB/MazE/SpoVT family DNA-binding domain-containing protein [Verrucomicrobiota bacterium]
MRTKLSTKGQIVLPKQARARLQLRPGTTLVCKVEGDSIVLTPEHPAAERPKLVRDAKTGLMVTQSPAHVSVSSDDVRSALADFP